MQRWEYKSVKGASEAELNQLGAQGWELVAVVMSDKENVRRFYFKRPRA